MAVDPRDAASRALTCAAPNGQFNFERFGVPVDVLRDIPANFDTFHELKHGDAYIAVREIDGATHPRTMLELRALWEILRDVPVADRCDELPDGSIGEPFLHFPKGVAREDVWHWFEAQNPTFVVGDALMGVWPQ